MTGEYVYVAEPNLWFYGETLVTIYDEDMPEELRPPTERRA